MKTLNIKSKVIAIGAVAAATLLPAAHATAALANDTFEFLPALGSDFGAFLTAILPGVMVILIVLGVLGGLFVILNGIGHAITKGFRK